MNTFPSLVSRFAALPARAIESSLRLREGRIHDYECLSEHHYLAARPATVTRVLVLEHEVLTATDRFAKRSPTPAPAAVLVESLPPLHGSLRGWALRGRYGAMRDLQARAQVLNREIRCISRVVVHPQWRGLGLAVHLVRTALSTATTPVTEAYAAMGHVNPFFERAGMTAHLRPPHTFDRRLTEAMAKVGLEQADLTIPGALIERIAAMPWATRHFITSELTRWHRHTAGRSRTDAADLRSIVKAARNRLLLTPVYYVHVRA